MGSTRGTDGIAMIKRLSELVAGLREGNAPKYRALRDVLARAISRGVWKPGERLPTEIELAERLPFSLGTVQKAYGHLVEEGLIVRRRGSGSFVSNIARQMPEPWHCRFLQDDGSVLPVYPRYLGHEKLANGSSWRRLLGTSEQVVRIDRALSINREFDVLSRFYASMAVAAPLLRLPKKEIESANFKAIILRELNLPIIRIGQTVRLPADTGIHDAPAGFAGKAQLVVEAVAYTRDEAIAYYQEIFIPANDRRLLFESNLKVYA